jgi:hypothetical protein
LIGKTCDDGDCDDTDDTDCDDCDDGGSPSPPCYSATG